MALPKNFVLIFSITLILAPNLILSQDPPTFFCTMDQFGQCIFTNVIVERPQTRFKPQSDNSSFVTMIGFRDSHIQVFSPDICAEFTETKVMRLHDLGIEELAEGAFERCLELTHLTFYSGNQIKTLPPGAFNSNVKLVALDLEGNRLKTIGDTAFGTLTALVDLHLQNNLIERFSTSVLEKLPNLKYLYLHNNNMLDFDRDYKVEAFQNLKEISYFGNPLACTRVVELNLEFKDAGVSVFQKFEKLPDYYQPSRAGNTSCLTDRIWLDTYEKRNTIMV